MARNRRGSRSRNPDNGAEIRQGVEPGKLGIKVVSGGQTGVDRGALDAALELNIPCGGWCPEGRLAEDGTIPEQYPVKELEGGDYRDRTRKNVLDSDGTAIIYFGEIEGGTESTLDDCVQMAKPYQLINGEGTETGQAAKQIAEFVRDRGLRTLNIAGPRASKVDRGHKYAFDTVRMLIEMLSRKGGTSAKKSGSSSGKRRKQRGQANGQGGNGAAQPGTGRNAQLNAQKRKGLGQHYRAKHGVKRNAE